MSLLGDILKWTKTLPMWQRDAVRRLFQKESDLSAADYDDLSILLKGEYEIECDKKVAAEPLAESHLSTGTKPSATVILKSLKNLRHVNCIPTDQILEFSSTGLTIVYGGNGSGKSGYARVMKRACRARDQSEPIHPNANDPAAKEAIPRATFVVQVGGKDVDLEWSRGATPPEKLSAISVFDSKCARSYLTAEKDVAYLPYGLDIVENLAQQVLPRLTQMLGSEIVGIDTSLQAFDHLRGDTEVGKAIEKLNRSANPAALISLGTLNEVEKTRITELRQTLKEADPMAKSKDLRLSSNRLKASADLVVKPLAWVSDRAVEKLQKLDKAKTTAELAESRAADTLRSGDNLLPGTGEQVWKALFEAARRFSLEEAYPEEDFPNTAEDAVCPLCQELLPQAAKCRLRRFEEYIKNDVAKAANEARGKLQGAQRKIEAADLKIGGDKAMLEELRDFDGALPAVITDFANSLDARRTSMLASLKSHDWKCIPPLSENPRSNLRNLAAKQLLAARMHRRAADEERRRKLTLELEELTAREALEKNLKAILALVERMKAKTKLERCRASLKTRPISDKSKEFANSAVTGALKDALDREFHALGIGRIKTRLKDRIDKGKMLHQLLLDIPTTARIEEILSEGEQRAIAIGSFLAELSLANHSCGIVFDDPVSSLDHWRRRDVAKRLVQEAKLRQVVIFTHDTAFLGQLCDEIDVGSVTNSMFFLEWRGPNPGYVNDGLPWDHQGYKARIDALEKAQRRLQKSWPAYPNEAESAQMRTQYDRLRATIERVIQDVVFNGVVKRYRDWIRVDSLEAVVGFEYSEYKSIDILHKRCCSVVTGHDPSSAKSATIPTADELGKDIEALKAVIDTIKQRRQQAKDSP